MTTFSAVTTTATTTLLLLQRQQQRADNRMSDILLESHMNVRKSSIIAINHGIGWLAAVFLHNSDEYNGRDARRRSHDCGIMFPSLVESLMYLHERLPHQMLSHDSINCMKVIIERFELNGEKLR